MNQEIKLNVPLIRQEPHSVECGLVALEMIYSFYGMPQGMDNLRKELPTVEVGTYGPQLGLNFIKHGLITEIITHNPRLVEKIDRNLSQTELLEKFRQKSQTLKDDSDKLAIRYFIEFMENKGIVTVKIPTIEVLREQLKKGRPVIASLTNAPIYKRNIADLEGKPFNYTFHAVVTTGLGNGVVYINDPYAEEDGGAKNYSEEEFLYAVYSCALGDLDNADFMVAYKP